MTVTSAAPSGKPSPSLLLAREVRAELARQGISYRAFALRLGVAHAWVTRRISPTSADKAITFEELDQMAEALGVTAERLVASSGWLPRLDSNQQPSGSSKPQVIRPVTRLSDVRRRKQEVERN